MSLLALDLGSSNIKGAIFSSNLERLSQASLPVPYSTWQGPIVEMDPQAFWQRFIDLTRQLFRDSRLTPYDIEHIAISSQAQTFTLLDRDLQPLTPLISWIDRRGAEFNERLSQELGETFHEHCSFPSTLPELQLSKLYYLNQVQPDLLQRTYLAAPLPAWLSLRLGGLPIIDRSLAAMSGLYSLQTGAWYPRALGLCRLLPDMLPMLVNCGYSIPTNTPPGFLSLLDGRCDPPSDHLVFFSFCGNDQTCGALAASLQPGEILLSLGTALVAYRLAGDVLGPYSPSGCWGPYPGGGYYELAVCSQGTSALEWALRRYFPGSTLNDLGRLANTISETDSTSRPFFYPQAMETPQAFTGQAEPAALALSIYEGLSFSLRNLIENALDIHPEKLVAAGGGSQGDFWLQSIADVTGIPVQRCASSALSGDADPLLGAALQVFHDHPSLSTRHAGFIPNPAKLAPFTERYQKWLVTMPVLD
jgi:xylulokinase